MSGWAALLRLAAERYRIAPAEFWRLSLAEWRALTAEPAADVLTRRGLEALAQRFPDEDA